MIACVDVAYRPEAAFAAVVVFRGWGDPTPCWEGGIRLETPAPYEPGRFYRRELEPVLAVLRICPLKLSTVIVDGYVWLDRRGTAGLGAYVHQALGGTVAVIGVAKNRYGLEPFAAAVRRGRSLRPLYVTAAGMEPAAAARHVFRMHGAGRIPTLLRWAHRLAETLADSSVSASSPPKKAEEKIQDQSQSQTHDEAGGEGEREGPGFSAQVKVSGQVSQPEAARAEAEEQARHDQQRACRHQQPSDGFHG